MSRGSRVSTMTNQTKYGRQTLGTLSRSKGSNSRRLTPSPPPQPIELFTTTAFGKVRRKSISSRHFARYTFWTSGGRVARGFRLFFFLKPNGLFNKRFVMTCRSCAFEWPRSLRKTTKKLTAKQDTDTDGSVSQPEREVGGSPTTKQVVARVGFN